MQLTEKEAEDFLEKNRFEVAKRAIASDKFELSKISKKIPFPWVMKASSSKIVHKKQSGGVILAIKTLKMAEEAYEKLSKIENFDSAMVQEMISGTELIIGLKKSPEFSHTLMFGKGGSNVETEKDVSFRVIPVSKKDIKEMIEDTKIASSLKEKNINLDEIEKNLLLVSKLASKYKKILELDINPLIVNDKNAVVVDARILFGD